MTSTKDETVLGNARIVLADRVIERGWIAFADGRVAEVGEGNGPAGSGDAEGDLIMPGLIELHTDHLEAHYVPRPKVFWDPILVGRPDVRLMSLMDHTPGQRQFRDEGKLRTYYRGKGAGMTDAELDMLFERRFAYQKAHAATNMREIVALAQQYEIPLASHDDTTDENVTDAIRDRVSVAEFPTTIEAARGLHRAGIGILMGAPNVVRGGSHSGNIAAVDLAREGLLDILSSDYIPSSLLMAALQLPQRVPAIDLASAVGTVTKTPAEAVGLTDRGEIAPGKRADLIRVHIARDIPVVRSVWREGHRVA